ncbi:hypothetical protein [Streptomyces sp. NPDC051776]|uniref:hypothetical protein n=1 Tax=Streptomyces sp. NPDC051776 TaxID=3155414 RepID=UPI0034469C19
MTTHKSTPDGGPKATRTASSYGTGVDEPAVELVHPVEPDSADTPLEVPMFVEHFNVELGPGNFKRRLNWGPSVISSATSVWVSVCELNPVTGKPRSAAARIEIHDICPEDGGTVAVAGRIFGFENPILVQFRALAI